MTILSRASEWTKSSARPLRHFHAAPSAQHYFAFLSYSHRDEGLAQWLHDALERFRVPKHLVGRVTEHGPIPRRLTPIFRDLRELPASDDLGSEICEALAATRFLVVLCSPAAANSHWTSAEIEAFKRVRPDGRILAAVIAGEPFASDTPGREKEECLPRALRFKYDRRGKPTAKRAELLAADLRDGGEGRRLGFLKLVAGMLGVGLDELVQRETLRRQRRLAVLAAASIAGMAGASGLAVVAIQARDEARDERREAEGLIGFMLGDLRGKLEPVGRLDALDGVGARVLAYYQEQDTSDLSDGALAQRSRALALMGEIAKLRGDFDGALRLYREAMDGTGEALKRAPDDPERLFDHAQNVFWVGEIARHRGRMDGAEAAFREYKRLADRMIAIDPDNLKWRMEVQYAEANLGTVLLDQRRFAEAAQQFEGALSTIEAVAAIDPRNSDYQKSIADGLAWLADARLAEGRFDDAIAQRKRQLDLLRRLMRSGNADVEYRQKAIPAHRSLGMLFAAKGEIETGIEHLRAAVAHSRHLIPLEVDNTLWLELGAAARLDLAELLMVAGQPREAVQETRAGCAIVERLTARDRSAVQWRAPLRNCLIMRARIALAANAPAEALRLANRALIIARSKPGDDSGEAAYLIAHAHRLVGDIHRVRGDEDSARSAWQAGFAALPRVRDERPKELSARAELLQRLGREAEAQVIAGRLKALGWNYSQLVSGGAVVA